LKFKAGVEKSIPECEEIIRNLKAGYPALTVWQNETKMTAKQKLYTETWLGRRRYLPNIRSDNWGLQSFAERCALNTPIQGTAADILKLAIVRILEGLPSRPWLRPILQIHDELLIEAPLEEEEEVKNTNIIKMIKVIKLICVVLVGYFIVRVMFPSLMPLKINTNIAFVAAVAGIVVYIFSDKVPDKLLTHFVKKEYIQKYETQINYQPENDSNINNDVIEKENSHTQEYEHTMLLSDYMESIKKKEPEINLIYTGDEDMENISVEKLPCVVGSMEGRCNKVIHNRLVSHIHMCIVKINDDFYIEDMNSTNGTSVNGRRIATNQRCVIKNGDDIYIAALPYKVEIT